MRRYLVRRGLEMIPLLLLITVISFALIRAVPGGPLSAFELDPNIKPEDVERIRQNLGLDRPLWEQYFVWLFAMLRGALGRSLVDGRSIAAAIGARVANTLLLTVLALVLQYAIAVPIGVHAALNHRRLSDQIANLYASVIVAVPGVWVVIP